MTDTAAPAPPAPAPVVKGWDIDAAWAAKRAAEGKPAVPDVEWRLLHYQGKDWRVCKDPNGFTLFESGDGVDGASVRAFLELVHPDERSAFRLAIHNDPGMLGDEKITFLLDQMMTNWTGLPLAPAASSPTSSTTTGLSSTETSSTSTAQGGPDSPAYP